MSKIPQRSLDLRKETSGVPLPREGDLWGTFTMGYLYHAALHKNEKNMDKYAKYVRRTLNLET